jgi:hypothetical protein
MVLYPACSNVHCASRRQLPLRSKQTFRFCPKASVTGKESEVQTEALPFSNTSPWYGRIYTTNIAITEVQAACNEAGMCQVMELRRGVTHRTASGPSNTRAAR